MSTSLWNFTVPATSPMFTYSFFTGNQSTGWQTYCTTIAARCDEYTAHVTSAASSVSLSFNGTGIALYGNMTESISITATLEDGTEADQGVDAASQLLAGFSGLPQANHEVTLTVSPSSSAAVLYFTEAVVTVDTGIPNAGVVSIYIDDTDPSVMYDTGWYPYQAWSGATAPPEISNTSFHASMVAGATASVRFNGSAVFLYGPCYGTPATGPYQIQLSPVGIDLSLNTTTPRSNILVSCIEQCLRFFATGLDPTVEMELSTASLVDGLFTSLDYVQIVGYQLSAGGFSSNVPASTGQATRSSTGISLVGESSTRGLPSSSTSRASASNSSTATSSTPIGPIVGGLVGGICILIFFVVGVIILRRSKAGQNITPFWPRPSLVDEPPPLTTLPPPYTPQKSNGSTVTLASSARPEGSARARRRADPPLGGIVQASPRAPRVIPVVLPLHELHTDFVSIPLAAPVVTNGPSAVARKAAGRSSHINTGAAVSTAPQPSLAEITTDVNRILGQLARLGRRPVPGGMRDEEPEEDDGDDEDDGLPSYGEARL